MPDPKAAAAQQSQMKALGVLDVISLLRTIMALYSQYGPVILELVQQIRDLINQFVAAKGLAAPPDA